MLPARPARFHFPPPPRSPLTASHPSKATPAAPSRANAAPRGEPAAVRAQPDAKRAHPPRTAARPLSIARVVIAPSGKPLAPPPASNAARGPGSSPGRGTHEKVTGHGSRGDKRSERNRAPNAPGQGLGRRMPGARGPRPARSQPPPGHEFRK
jgi:hypothetical protein